MSTHSPPSVLIGRHRSSLSPLPLRRPLTPLQPLATDTYYIVQAQPASPPALRPTLHSTTVLLGTVRPSLPARRRAPPPLSTPILMRPTPGTDSPGLRSEAKSITTPRPDSRVAPQGSTTTSTSHNTLQSIPATLSSRHFRPRARQVSLAS